MGIMIQFHCVITLFLISTDMCLRTNVPFQYTISGNREQVFLLYYKDFFEQICSDVQFISPPEEVGEFLLHLLKMQNEMKLTDESWISYQQGKGNEEYQKYMEDLTEEREEVLRIWNDLSTNEQETVMSMLH